jgi:hypothetical protein
MTTLATPRALTCGRCRHTYPVLVDDTDLCIDCDALLPTHHEPTGPDMTITPQQRLAVLKHLANGRTLDVTAAMTRLTRDQVLDIGNHHGYPDTDKLSWAVDVLTDKIDQDETAAAVSTSPASPSGVKLVQEPTRAPATTPFPRSTVTTTAAALLPTDSTPDLITSLLNTGKASGSKRIRNLANRILDDVDKLRGLITAEQETAAANEREARQKAEARAEVERLKKQLAAAQAKLRPATTTPRQTAAKVATGATAKDIRAWAAANGIHCNPVGRPHRSVVDAYTAAHTKAAS